MENFDVYLHTKNHIYDASKILQWLTNNILDNKSRTRISEQEWGLNQNTLLFAQWAKNEFSAKIWLRQFLASILS